MLKKNGQNENDNGNKSSEISYILNSLSLLAVDPINLRGIVIKGRAGHIRQKLFTSIEKLFADYKFQKIYPNVLDSELFGGLDFSRTFETGRPVKSLGHLNQSKAIILISMAERLENSLISKYGTAIETNNNLTVIASDEGIEDEKVGEALTDRLGFFVSINDLHHSEAKNFVFNKEKIRSAQEALSSISIDSKVIKMLTEISVQLGIDSFRAPILASYAARASAAFSNNLKILEEDILNSIELVLSHKAKRFLDNIDSAEPEIPEELSGEEDDTEGNAEAIENAVIPAEMLLNALKSNLSPEVLKNLITQSKKKFTSHQTSSGSGVKRLSNRKGRPLPSRAGKFDNTRRLDIIETLKSAAPWQTIRREKLKTTTSNIIIRGEDIRIKRHLDQSDRLIIFAVDASGTSALGRLGETKGAIEILLSEAYSRRDYVALISFRGKKAEIELPPTRSLVLTKKRLAGLPAGGGTPLASALFESYQLALQAKLRGMTPSLAILTDGKGNISLDGTPNRQNSVVETKDLAQKISSSNIPAIVIDTSNRPQLEAKDLGNHLNAKYIALPRADSKRLSSAVATIMD